MTEEKQWEEEKEYNKYIKILFIENIPVRKKAQCERNRNKNTTGITIKDNLFRITKKNDYSYN